jgi:hypothetical protein
VVSRNLADLALMACPQIHKAANPSSPLPTTRAHVNLYHPPFAYAAAIRQIEPRASPIANRTSVFCSRTWPKFWTQIFPRAVDMASLAASGNKRRHGDMMKL